MDAPVRIEENGEPRFVRPLTRRIDPPLKTADSLAYVRACMPGEANELELLALAAFVRHVLADIRDLPSF